MSLALTGGAPELRVVFEAQAADGALPARWQAGLEVNRRIRKRLGLSFERLRAVEDLFVPSAPAARFAIWHALSFHPTRAPEVKVYLNPRAQGRERAASVVREAIARLGLPRTAEAVAACPRPDDELAFFSLDIDDSPHVRAKIYKIHHDATRADLERALSPARDYVPGVVADICRMMAGTDGPFRGVPIGTSLALNTQDARPTAGALHFPVADYCGSDRIVYERVLRLLDGVDREHYARAMNAFAARPLQAGIGMQPYVSLGIRGGARRVSVGLGLEAYHVAPPRHRDDRLGGARRFDETSFRRAPSLDGGLLTDPRSCIESSSDTGGLVSRRPGAVLRPRSRDDVIEMIRFCRDEGIPVTPRGQGHTMFGQSLSDGGVVIDMSSFCAIRAVSSDRIVVDAGATWKDVLQATTAVGLTPPVLTTYQGLSVGGTLSVGGIGAASYKRGAQVDHVIELEVVTGEGRLVVCSASQHRDLFEAVLAGLGQCAVIVRATLHVIPAPSHVRSHVLRYASLDRFLAAMRRLAVRRLSDGLWGTICAGTDGFRYQLTAFDFTDAPRERASPVWLCDTAVAPTSIHTRVDGYVDFHLAVDRKLAALSAAGDWDGRARPWLNLFLPDRSIEGYLDQTLPTLDLGPDGDLGPPEMGPLGQIHLCPLLHRHLGRPMFRVPGDELMFLIDILTCASGERSDRAYRARLLDRNQRLYERARAVGGTRYAPSALPFSRADWIRHFGPMYGVLAEQKRLHDPDHLLGASVGMF